MVILISNRMRCKNCISRKVQAMFSVWHFWIQWIPNAILYWSRTIFHLFFSCTQSNSLFFTKMAFVSLNNSTLESVIKRVRRRLLQVQNMYMFYISQLHQRYFISFIHISNAEEKLRLITDPHSHRYFLTYYCKNSLPHYFELGSLCYNYNR